MRGITSVILVQMKTAISIPDEVFDAAEEVAAQLGFSRSELYAKAVAAFVKDHRHSKVTAALNAVYKDEPSALDPGLARMQWASLVDEEWS